MYLTEKHRTESGLFNRICTDWSMNEDVFAQIVDNWFTNFERKDYDLALDILMNVDYYNKERYDKALKNIWGDIEKRTNKNTLSPGKVLLIVPDGYGDSAHAHTYETTKEWGITREQIYSVSQLSSMEIGEDNILILFNDTHGTGNQFVTEMVDKTVLKKYSETHWVFVVGLSISDTARKYIEYAMPHAHILPEAAPKTVYSFSNQQVERIREIGADIYPCHPLGYGGVGFLVAYYFQCPNNSIPMIWANSETKNNEFEGYTYQWKPLCQYKPKIKSPIKKEDAYQVELHATVRNIEKKKFAQKTNLEFTKGEIEQINNILNSWKCSLKKHNEIVSRRLTKWFNNFEPQDKRLALDIFSNISYLSLARTREEIKKLRDKVMNVVKRNKGERKDIILVVTGDEIESSYHYVYDFMQKWGLQLSQVLTLKHICKHPYEAIGKHLVFFHHTRIHKNETFISEVWPRVQKLPAKHFHILSFLMSDVAILLFDTLKQEVQKETGQIINYYYCESISKPLRKILKTKKDLVRLTNLLESKSVKEKDIGKKFLTAYYFKCPKDTLSLLWYSKNMSPLFPSKD